jgi:hypothetical protein
MVGCRFENGCSITETLVLVAHNELSIKGLDSRRRLCWTGDDSGSNRPRQLRGLCRGVDGSLLMYGNAAELL